MYRCVVLTGNGTVLFPHCQPFHHLGIEAQSACGAREQRRNAAELLYFRKGATCVCFIHDYWDTWHLWIISHHGMQKPIPEAVESLSLGSLSLKLS